MCWALQAMKVLDDVLDHNGQRVTANTILFNITKVRHRISIPKKRGIAGVDSRGVVHTFLEGEEQLFFSTQLFDVKCSPVFFKDVLELPQMARAYLHPNTELANSLHNLSTVTFTDVSHGHHPIVLYMSDSGDKLGPTFSLPLNADLKV